MFFMFMFFVCMSCPVLTCFIFSCPVRGTGFFETYVCMYVCMYVQGPPKKCIHTLTKESSMLYVSTNFNYTSQVECTLQ